MISNTFHGKHTVKVNPYSKKAMEFRRRLARGVNVVIIILVLLAILLKFI